MSLRLVLLFLLDPRPPRHVLGHDGGWGDRALRVAIERSGSTKDAVLKRDDGVWESKSEPQKLMEMGQK